MQWYPVFVDFTFRVQFPNTAVLVFYLIRIDKTVSTEYWSQFNRLYSLPISKSESRDRRQKSLIYIWRRHGGYVFRSLLPNYMVLGSILLYGTLGKCILYIGPDRPVSRKWIWLKKKTLKETLHICM